MQLLDRDAGLQRSRHARATMGLLLGLEEPELRVLPGPRSLALLDQHVPQLGARSSVPLSGTQRRDQHAQGQCELYARERGHHEK